MSRYLLIPAADGDSLANATLVDSAPEPGSAEARVYRLSAASGSFVAAGTSRAAPDARPGRILAQDWALEPGAKPGQARLTLAALPVGAPDVSAVQYTVDGGASWINLGAPLPGAYVLDLAGPQAVVALRAINAAGAGEPSASRTVTVSTPAVTTIAVSADKRSYALTLPEGISTISINGTIHAVDTAAIIGKPPVVLADVGVSGNVAALQPGGSVSYTLAPYLYDPAGGVPEVVLSTLRNGAVVGAGDSYGVAALDLAIGFSARQQVINANGAGSRLTRFREPALYAPAPLRFTGSQRLYGEGMMAGALGNVVIAMTFALPERMTPGPVAWITDTTGRDAIYIETRSNGGMLFGVTSAADALIFDAGDLTALAPADTLGSGHKLTLLATVGNTRASRVVLRDGTLLRAATKTTGAPYAMRMDNGVYVGGSKWNVFGKVELYDMRIWAGVAGLDGLDVTQGDVQALFISSEGAMRDPALANGVFGTPALWVPIDRDKANALVNLGSGGNFKNKTGVLS